MSLPPYPLKGRISRAIGIFNSITTGSIVSTGVNAASVANALTASTTQTLAGALALTKAVNRLTTVANAGDAVSLPALTPGQTVTLYNDGANSTKVFPAAASYAIDGGSAGASVNLAAGKRCIYTCVAANVIISAQHGVVSA